MNPQKTEQSYSIRVTIFAQAYKRKDTFSQPTHMPHQYWSKRDDENLSSSIHNFADV